ncbi:MAG: hypothetical protein FJX42_12305 [Alphaproteobacteria bacterium]|nr:hypothetical protein [Alphaproteobacteria bacterium]
MTILYVARSKGLAEWGGDVGLTKHLFKVGVAETSGRDGVKALNERALAGQSDWTLLKDKDAGTLTEAEALARLAAREKAVDPALYPRLKGETGIFKIKPANVENHLLVKRALANEENIAVKVGNAEIALYLIENTLR